MIANPTKRTTEERAALIEAKQWFQIHHEKRPDDLLFEGTEEECRQHARTQNFLLSGPHSHHSMGKLIWESPKGA